MVENKTFLSAFCGPLPRNPLAWDPAAWHGDIRVRVTLRVYYYITVLKTQEICFIVKCCIPLRYFFYFTSDLYNIWYIVYNVITLSCGSSYPRLPPQDQT